MAHASPFTLYTRFADCASLARFLFFLEEDSRPAFPDEVTHGESQWVGHFEFLSYPWSVKQLDNVTVVADFGDPHEEQDLSGDITPMMEGATGLGAELVLVFWCYEEECFLERYVKGHREVVWSMDVEADEDKNQELLSRESQEQLRKIYEEAEDAAEVLAQIASELAEKGTEKGDGGIKN